MADPLFVVAGNDDEYRAYLQDTYKSRNSIPTNVSFAGQLRGYALGPDDVVLFGTYEHRKDWREIQFAIESATHPRDRNA